MLWPPAGPLCSVITRLRGPDFSVAYYLTALAAILAICFFSRNAIALALSSLASFTASVSSTTSGVARGSAPQSPQKFFSTEAPQLLQMIAEIVGLDDAVAVAAALGSGLLGFGALKKEQTNSIYLCKSLWNMNLLCKQPRDLCMQFILCIILVLALFCGSTGYGLRHFGCSHLSCLIHSPLERFSLSQLLCCIFLLARQAGDFVHATELLAAKSASFTNSPSLFFL